jgi:hypothetical protein
MASPTHSRRNKEAVEHKCRRKLCHRDYLSALRHAQALAESNISIYPCSICKGLHVGHDRLRYAAHCDREGKAKAEALLRRIRVHEGIVARHGALVCVLKAKLENTRTEYLIGTPSDFLS